MNIAVLQPIVPTYREEFFLELGKLCNVDIFVYKDYDLANRESTETSSLLVRKIKNVQKSGFVIYDFLPFLNKKYDVIVLMLTINHPITLLLLSFKWLHKKKIVLWGQGISVKRYLTEEQKPDWKLRWQIMFADGIWLYMKKEMLQWNVEFMDKPMVALNNTISGTKRLLDVAIDKNELKRKYNVIQPKMMIFCARFESVHRRVDLLIDVIERLDSQEFGFVIIGAGKNKPDFSKYDNVYDFGAVYDKTIKDELFSIADIYFQPGWVGLSIVEAMAYGKPVCTFVRSEETLQCVEYSYIEDGKNGYIFQDMDDCLYKLQNTSIRDFNEMGDNARKLVRNSLTPDKMAANAFSVLQKVCCK